MQLDERDKTKALQIIREIVAASGGVLEGKTRLNKVFYFSHLFYWEQSPGVLSDYPIIRMPQGPAIDDLDSLLSALEESGVLKISCQPKGPYKEYVYRLTAEPDSTLTESEREAIKYAVNWSKEMTARELSDITHEYSRTWNNTQNGKEMEVCLDAMDDEAYNEMKKRQNRLKDLIDAAFEQPEAIKRA